MVFFFFVNRDALHGTATCMMATAESQRVASLAKHILVPFLHTTPFVGPTITLVIAVRPMAPTGQTKAVFRAPQ